jgi:RNA polymerase primary sigma factor
MRLSDHNCKFFRSSDILNSFLAEVRKHPVPTVQEEEELFERYRNGDESAKDALIVGNLRFVFSLAKIYARNEAEVVDYVNEGVIGLMTALNEFDPSKGYKFITYGVWYIRRQMNYYMLTKRDLISQSAQVGNIRKKSDSFRQKYFAEFGHMPTDDEVKAALKESFNITVSKNEDISEIGYSSIEEDIADDYTVENSSEFNEATASENGYIEEAENDYRKEILKECMSVLSEKMSDIIKMRYGVGYDRAYTAEEIADKYGIDSFRIDKICEHAISMMRKVPVKRAI